MSAPARLDYNAVLSERIDLSPSLAIFRVQPDHGVPAGDAWFTPGQYVTIGLNNEALRELGAVERPMSIASSPQERRYLEFYVRRVERPASRNPLTRLLWERPIGSRLFVRLHPKGRFTIVDTVGASDRRVRVFVSAGTGLAPFMSIVRSAVRESDRSIERCVVLHGASYVHELGYQAELEALSVSRGLRYLPTVSRLAQQWHGSRGRVEDFFLPERIETTECSLGLDRGTLAPQRAVIYVCGLRGTVDQVVGRLLGRGFVPADRRMRSGLSIAEGAPGSLFWEQYDHERRTTLRSCREREEGST